MIAICARLSIMATIETPQLACQFEFTAQNKSLRIFCIANDMKVALKIKLKIKQGTSEKRKYGNIFYKSPSELLCSCESFRVKTDKVFKGGLL